MSAAAAPIRATLRALSRGPSARRWRSVQPCTPWQREQRARLHAGAASRLASGQLRRGDSDFEASPARASRRLLATGTLSSPRWQVAGTPGRVHDALAPLGTQTRHLLTAALETIGLGERNGVLSHRDCQVIAFPPDIVYGVICDVDNYASFLPWCVESNVLRCSADGTRMEAELAVGFRMLSERYVSVVTMRPGHVVATARDTSLFRSLRNEWRVRPGPTPGTSTVQFSVDFDFKSPVYANATRLVFDELVAQMVRAFVSRCRVVQAQAEARARARAEVVAATSATAPSQANGKVQVQVDVAARGGAAEPEVPAREAALAAVKAKAEAERAARRAVSRFAADERDHVREHGISPVVPASARPPHAIESDAAAATTADDASDAAQVRPEHDYDGAVAAAVAAAAARKARPFAPVLPPRASIW